MVRIVDIAKRVNRSITTVSRALNGYEDVSPETRQLIIDTAEEMGYTPNSIAQLLQRKQTMTIGLVLPTFSPRFSDPYFSELLAGIGNKAAELGYDLLVSTRPPGEEEMDYYKKLSAGGRVDGFIVIRTRTNDARIRLLVDRKFPFVAFGRSAYDAESSFVDEDGHLGMQLIAEHLSSLGHERIACITSNRDFTFTHHRLNGLLDGLAKAGLKIEPGNILEGDLTQKSGYELGSELLERKQRPSAIAAFNDLMAFGVMSAAQERGLTVGKDISVTGFDGIPMGEYSHPPLTTVSQPIYKIGAMTCEMLVKALQSDSPAKEQILLQPSLIVRQSTGAASPE